LAVEANYYAATLVPAFSDFGQQYVVRRRNGGRLALMSPAGHHFANDNESTDPSHAPPSL